LLFGWDLSLGLLVERLALGVGLGQVEEGTYWWYVRFVSRLVRMMNQLRTRLVVPTGLKLKGESRLSYPEGKQVNARLEIVSVQLHPVDDKAVDQV
jgi:hypothetical protein